ncbi:hypothetical protein GCM10027411_07290 [Microbacterium aureliae]
MHAQYPAKAVFIGPPRNAWHECLMGDRHKTPDARPGHSHPIPILASRPNAPQRRCTQAPKVDDAV